MSNLLIKLINLNNYCATKLASY